MDNKQTKVQIEFYVEGEPLSNKEKQQILDFICDTFDLNEREIKLNTEEYDG